MYFGQMKYKDVYAPLSRAFISELKRLDVKYQDVPAKLVKYLIGEYPFYKVIKDDTYNVVIVKVFNVGSAKS